jgi:hypothetical protein
MSLHYQVYSDFTLTNGKALLINTAIFSTTAACTTVPFYPYENNFLTTSRIFPNLEEAQSYIGYLHLIYPDSPAPPPVLYNGQKELFAD